MNTSTLATPAGRKSVVFLELLRIIACFFVLVNHTTSDIFLSMKPCDTWFASLAYFFASKIAVPLFLMIAGYLMLDKQYSYQKVRKSFGRILLCLVLFSGVYYLYYYSQWYYNEISLGGFFTKILSEPITRAYWYLYLYLGILLMLPFLQKMVANMDRKDFHAFFLIYALLVYGPLVLGHYVPTLSLSGFFSLPLMESTLCMLMLGCYMKRYVVPSGRWRIVCLIAPVLAVAATVGLTCLEYLRSADDYLFYDGGNHLTALIAAVSVFYLAMTATYKGLAQRWICFFGELTFGIYLLGDLFIMLLKPVYETLLSRGIPVLAATVLFEILVFFAGAVTTWILKKLPVLGKLL